MGNYYLLLSALFLATRGAYAASPMSYEWWFDNDVSSVNRGEIVDQALNFEVDTSELPGGLHTFNGRLLTEDGEAGSIFHKSFLVPAQYDSQLSYEYWIDDDYAAKVAGEIDTETSSFEISLPPLSPGLHYFNYRLKRGVENWGPIYRASLFIPSHANEIEAYEYWIDNDFAGRTEKLTSGTTDIFEIDLNSYDLSTGKHWFNLRVRNKNGEWGSIYRKLIMGSNTVAPAKILGYRHYANDLNLGYVALGHLTDPNFELTTSLPDKDILTKSSLSFFKELPEDTFPLLYVVQFETDRGWMPPVRWVLELDKLTCQDVRVSYDGRYLRLITDEEEAEILFKFDGAGAVEEAVYDQPVDVLGLGSLSARAQKQGYKDSETVEYDVRYYADEEHAVTADGGLLEAAFEWDEEGVKDMVESYRLEGILNEEDYRFVGTMESLRHLDIKDVNEVRIPDRAFADSKLVSISLPENLMEYGENLFDGSTNLSSVVWNSTGRSLNTSLTGGLLNPNVLLYVPAENLIDDPTGLNIVTDGKASSINLLYGYPYYAERDFHADKIQLIQEFTQETTIDQCGGWETLVLPFTPDRIIHERYGETVPFAAWDGDVKGDYKPFWLYSSTTDGWEMASTIEQDVPYIISMPNNPEYVYFYNLAGKVKFAATDVEIVTESNVPYATNWIEDTQFVGTYMPIKDEGILSLNVADTGGELTPGSVFVRNAETPAFGAYVRDAASRKQMPVFGKSTGILLPAVADGNIVVTSPAPSTISISSTRECKVQIITSTGIIMHTLDLNPGETRSVEGLPKDLYIVAGAKVLVR